MAILKKNVVKYGTACHIVMPKTSLGKDAMVILEDDFTYFTELIRNAYALSKMGDHEIRRIDSDMKMLREDITPRLAFIERTLASMVGKSYSHTQNSDTPKE